MKAETPRLWPSMAKLLIDPGKGPASVWRQYLAPDRMQSPESRSQKRGTVIDALVFGTKEVLIGNMKTKHDPKKQIVVSPSLYAECSVAASSISAFLVESDIEISKCETQERLIWTTEGGVECSGRPDFYDPKSETIVDLKTSYSLSDEEVEGTIKRYSYEIQAAAYLEAYSKLGRGRKSFAWLFSEKDPPHLCRWVIPGPQRIGSGSAKWMKAATVFKDCLSSGEWYGPRPLVLL